MKDNSNQPGYEVQQVAIQLTDANGIPVTHADADITCTVSGGGILLGLEAGDNSDMGDYTDNLQKTFRGRLIAYVKKTGKTGAVKVTFASRGLKGVTVTL